jgi:hypothetical protein
MSVAALIVRLVRAVGSGLGAAIVIAVVYAIVDLYLSGHSVAVPLVRGRPLHRFVAEVLLFLVPVVVAAFVFWRDRPPAP